MPHQEQAALCREQLDRILNSREFAGSRQVREFLKYVSEAAFQNRSEIDQVEIAGHVLQREGEFNPVDDTSIRKLASVTRQKLRAYYGGQGSHDPVVVTLPHRLYLPEFRPRNKESRAGSRWWWWLVAAVLCSAGLLVLAVWRRPQAAPYRRFALVTRSGDLASKPAALAPDGVQLGMEVGVGEEVVGRMLFTPVGANQHAGIMIYGGPRQFVKFGRRFWSRVQTEFGVANRGVYSKPPGTFEYDPRGQDGSPMWLAIRRSADQFQAFRSGDGESWQRVGATLRVLDPMPSARLAVYAMQEAVGEPSAPAEFVQLGVGLSFHGRPDGPFDPGQFPDWRGETNCPDPPAIRIDQGALEYTFSHRKKCGWDFTRAVPAGDWAFSAKLDLLNFDGASAGIGVTGALGRFRLIRWNVEGGSVSAQSIPGVVVSQPDFKGSPPLWLRIECRGGRLRAAFSRDNQSFRRLPAEFSLTDLGPGPRFGLHASTQSWTSSETLPAARFQYVRQEALSLASFR